MKAIKIILLFLLPLMMTGCSGSYEESGMLIVESRDVQELLDGGYILVDAQKTSSYAKGHVKGARNIERNSITVTEPVPNSLAPAEMVARAATAAGLTESDNIVIYDSNANMDASRLYWTLKYYGHKGDIKIVSGGLNALKERNYSVSAADEVFQAGRYLPSSPDSSMLIDTDEVNRMIENDAASTVIIDVRTDDEYFAGTIPGSVHINFTENNFKDDSFKPVQQIRILYKDFGIMPEDTIVMYCKTSIRAANTYAALYNAGYRNLKIYDAAWLGWEASGNRIYMPERPGILSISVQDNS